VYLSFHGCPIGVSISLQYMFRSEIMHRELLERLKLCIHVHFCYLGHDDSWANETHFTRSNSTYKLITTHTHTQADMVDRSAVHNPHLLLPVCCLHSKPQGNHSHRQKSSKSSFLPSLSFISVRARVNNAT
jgi:hypothetical protein